MFKSRCKVLIKYLFLFLCGPLIVIIAMTIKSGASFDNIFVYDMKFQYIGFFSYYKNLLIGNESIFYSFTSGLGNNMLLNIYYYLGSPLNLLLFFISKKHLNIGINIILFTKIGLISLSMYYFLSKKYNLTDSIKFLFSINYATMSYVLTNTHNIMWLDSIIILPILLRSIDCFIEDKNYKFLLITLCLGIIINFYTGYMCIIFSFLYFLWDLVYMKRKKYIKIIVKYIFINFLSLLISSFVLFPIIFHLNEIRINRAIDYDILFGNFYQIKMLFKTFFQFLPFTTVDRASALLYKPNLYCGLIPFFLSFIYFLSNKISNKEKIISLFVVLIFIVSICTNFGIYVLHGFSHPFGYYYRFSFLFSTFVIVISANVVDKKILNITKKTVIISNIIIFIIFVVNYNKDLGSFSYFVWMFLVLLLLNLYSYIYWCYCKYTKKFLKVLMIIIIVIELFFNCFCAVITQKQFGKKVRVQYNNLYYNCQNKNKRLLLEYNNDRNYNMTCNSYGTDFSSSYNNMNIVKFYQKIGAYTSNNYYKMTYDTNDLIKKLLGIQLESKVDVKKKAEFIKKYSDTLSIGYMVSRNDKISYNTNPFEYQNNLVSAMVGYEVEPLKAYDTYNDRFSKNLDMYTKNIIINNDNDIYGYVYNKTFNKIYYDEFMSVSFDNISWKYIDYYNRYGMKKIKNYYKNKTVKFSLKTNKGFHNKIKIFSNSYFYYEDKNLSDKIIEELSKNQLEIVYWNKNILEGVIDVNERRNLFLSIPYDKNWKVYIDGKQQKYYKIYDTFIGVKLSKGRHKVYLKYTQRGFYEGIMLSILTICCLFLYTVISKKIN